jgi:hypothetical protein
MIFEPRRPLERHVCARTRHGSQSRRDERTKATRNVRRRNIGDWASAVCDGLLIAPHNAFDTAGECQIHTRVKGGISGLLEVDVYQVRLNAPRSIDGYGLQHAMCGNEASRPEKY